jgi:hypothetical protein
LKKEQKKKREDISTALKAERAEGRMRGGAGRRLCLKLVAVDSW